MTQLREIEDKQRCPCTDENCWHETGQCPVMLSDQEMAQFRGQKELNIAPPTCERCLKVDQKRNSATMHQQFKETPSEQIQALKTPPEK